MSLSNFIDEIQDFEDRTIKVDVREPESMFKLVKKYVKEFELNMDVERAVLKTGDYVYKNIGIERKEGDYRKLSDVLTKADELSRGYKYPFVMISENLDNIYNNLKMYKKEQRAESMLGMTSSLVARGVYPIFCSDKEKMIKIMLKIFDKITDDKEREIVQPIRPEPSTDDWKLHILCGLPHVGEVKAKSLMEHFGSVRTVMTASQKQLIKVDGIGKKIASDIVKVVNE